MTALAPCNYDLPWGGTPGASSEAKSVERARFKGIYQLKEKLSGTSAIRDELFSLAYENGDVSESTLSKAYHFAIALPSYVEQPELSVDTDGEIAFDWADEQNILSISVGGSGRVTYAGKFKEATTHGTLYLSDRVIPELANALKHFRR
ncbi:hypothetical protein J4G52_13255 [Burkholderia cenocepacia]|uniref:hypothetical protein n=1 Tax=Burkholderia TaxID=32008 RepID=UPI0012B9C211|nr:MULTISPECIES: hypothetical protein [Burkholderia]MBO1854506.1 hypothetical protein [Burkholderia cenocepacia]MDG0067931.1 hypothetical protein [Burkholderia sp. IO2]